MDSTYICFKNIHFRATKTDERGTFFCLLLYHPELGRLQFCYKVVSVHEPGLAGCPGLQTRHRIFM